MKPYTEFEDWHLEKLSDPEDAKVYLQIALEEYEQDNDTGAFLLAIRDVVQAQGGIRKLAESTSLNRQSLYKALSDKGNPRLDTLGAVLHALGYRLSIELLDNPQGQVSRP
jgi:probable addiction module antidote protein